ncbi:poly(A) polymerase [Thiovibrio frasassiensis]|uniref:Poly(A) polymerase n=1 Tax=Thiovibrio frasassiensis TaxID=2984131 RepID=A0A9X4MDI4_9BACT|nr:poly(A) polymerase [Thiovibrio frasassiensis]MDG4475574.1 poly(A) polymerase [Thiovibrio frasassiensis]
MDPSTDLADLPEPLIIPRADHPISRKDIDREALKVMHRLRDAGYSAYLVGGAVRDLYLGKKPKDFDISTNARPGQLRTLFRNSRIIGRRFRLVQVFFFGGKIVEVSTLRCRSEFEEGEREEDEVLAHNNTFGSEAEDAFRRDLTINALFYEIENFTIIDYTGGVADLNNRIVRIVGEPDRRIVRDPVRMMRAIRHAARSNFTIEERTWQAIIANLDTLRLCPDSRVRDEFFKDLNSGACAPWCRLAVASGMFFLLLPCYEGIISREPEAPTEETQLLFSLCQVIDRLHSEGTPLPEHLLLATLLLPWAQARFNLLHLPAEGRESFVFSRNLRAEIDSQLVHLNVKRASREDITSLLVNLPVFVRHGAEQTWPAWLKRKSYFPDGLLFFQLYQEALGGSPADLAPRPEPSLPPRHGKPRTGKSRKPRTESRTPSFSGKKGGIFGLK